MIPVEESTDLSGDRKLLVSEFCNLTDYGSSEILSFSSHSHLFLTRNGGLYKLENGKIEHLRGPSPDPSERI